MKKIFLIIVAAYFAVSPVFAQQVYDKSLIETFRKDLDKEYAEIVTEADKPSFVGLEYFPIDEKYNVAAKFVRTENEKPFEMVTSTARRPTYVKYGELHFTLDGTPCKLSVYQNLTLPANSPYINDLFLPFTDLTSGDETYGGGRFLDLKAPSAEMVMIDFNKAYNPYCAYNHKRSCPVPPAENHLTVPVKAGVLYKTKYPIHGAIEETPTEGYSPIVLLKELSLEELTGEKVDLSRFAGKPLVINFWATWCGPCVAEFAGFEKVSRRFGDKVAFLMVSDEATARIKNFKTKNSYALHIVRSLLPIGNMSLTSLPVTYFYNAKGEYITKNAAAMKEEEIARIVNQLLTIDHQ